MNETPLDLFESPVDLVAMREQRHYFEAPHFQFDYEKTIPLQMSTDPMQLEVIFSSMQDLALQLARGVVQVKMTIDSFKDNSIYIQT